VGRAGRKAAAAATATPMAATRNERRSVVNSAKHVAVKARTVWITVFIVAVLLLDVGAIFDGNHPPNW